jgi:basic membrane lipoprotein Med (substrate-binding protein (PBP1-ABC) superfamily)
MGDHGWTYRHDIGRQAIEKEFGDQVETTYVESVAEGADAERVIRNLATTGTQPDLHHLVRLHEPHRQGGRPVSGHQVRTCHRLQAG